MLGVDVAIRCSALAEIDAGTAEEAAEDVDGAGVIVDVGDDRAG